MSLQVAARIIELEELAYWTAFSLIFVAILLASSVLWRRKGEKLTYPFVLACLVSTWVGYAVNILNYQFLREVMGFTSNVIAASESLARMIGFYPHPNMAAFSLCLFFVLIGSDRRFLTASSWTRILVILAVLIGIVVTGSRTSLILFIVAFLMYLRNSAKMNGRLTYGRLVRTFTYLIIAGVLFVSALAFDMRMDKQSDLSETIVDRVQSISRLVDGSIAQNDESAYLRISIISKYAEDIADNPLLGYGPDYAFEQIEAGRFSNVSQNSWIEWAIRYGVFYPLAIAVIFAFSIYKNLINRAAWGSQQFMAVLVVILMSTLSLVDVFWLRSTALALGVSIGMATLTHKRAQYTAGNADDAHN